MSKDNEMRIYPMSDSEVGKLASGIAGSMKRDLPDFALRNITEADLNNFEVMIDDFNDLPIDEELIGELSDATEKKNQLITNIKVLVRPIRNMAFLAYKGKGKYRSFGFKDMDSMNDFETFRLATRVARVGKKHLTDLTIHGLTEGQLAAIKTLSNLLFSQIEACEDAVENRELEAENRVQKGNMLWNRMVELASIGKSLFEDTNPAKYNDYVLISRPAK